jgi:transcriptional regulator with XRE-family HTH domain
MYLAFANAIDTARRAKGLTHEQLSELCGISVGSVSNYGRGESLPSEEVTLVLMERLDAPHLGYIWLRSNKVGNMLLPEVSTRQLSQNILDLRVEMKHVSRLQDDIDEMGRDNQVENHEIPRWMEGMNELRDVIRSAFSLLLTPIQKEKTALKAVK